MAERGTRADIDLSELEKLASLNPSDTELAAWFQVNVRTIERRKKDPAFAEVLERGRAKGRLSLRRSQMKMAESNPTMSIWLGKNVLNQTDAKLITPQRVICRWDDLTSAELTALIEELNEIITQERARASPNQLANSPAMDINVETSIRLLTGRSPDNGGDDAETRPAEAH